MPHCPLASTPLYHFAAPFHTNVLNFLSADIISTPSSDPTTAPKLFMSKPQMTSLSPYVLSFSTAFSSLPKTQYSLDLHDRNFWILFILIHHCCLLLYSVSEVAWPLAQSWTPSILTLYNHGIPRLFPELHGTYSPSYMSLNIRRMCPVV